MSNRCIFPPITITQLAVQLLRSTHRTRVTMQACLLLSLCVLCLAAAAPSTSDLQTGTNDDGQTFIEEVVVESVLQVRTPTNRQARTNSQTSSLDGARVAEAKKTT